MNFTDILSHKKSEPAAKDTKTASLADCYCEFARKKPALLSLTLNGACAASGSNIYISDCSRSDRESCSTWAKERATELLSQAENLLTPEAMEIAVTYFNPQRELLHRVIDHESRETIISPATLSNRTTAGRIRKQYITTHQQATIATNVALIARELATQFPPQTAVRESERRIAVTNIINQLQEKQKWFSGRRAYPPIITVDEVDDEIRVWMGEMDQRKSSLGNEYRNFALNIVALARAAREKDKLLTQG